MAHVWPKANNVLITCVEDERDRKIMDRIREMRKTMAAQGLKAFLLPVEDVT